MIELDSFYRAAGLLPPSEWEAQRLVNYRKELFSQIPKFLNNEDFIIPDFKRGSGKTTKFLIESLHAEWHGFETIIVFRSVIEQYYAKHQYEAFKNKVLRVYGLPLVSGKTYMITKGISKYYNNQKVLWDTDD